MLQSDGKSQSTFATALLQRLRKTNLLRERSFSLRLSRTHFTRALEKNDRQAASVQSQCLEGRTESQRIGAIACLGNPKGIYVTPFLVSPVVDDMS